MKVKVECEYCGELFSYEFHGGHLRKYCSGSCRNRMYRLKLSEKEKEVA